MLVGLLRNHRFSHDLWAHSPWLAAALLLFLIGALPAVPDKYKPHLWLAAALLALISFLTSHHVLLSFRF